MRRIVIALGFVITCAGLAGAAEEQASSARGMLESGKYQEAIDAVASRGEEAAPQDIYVAGQSMNRLDRHGEARDMFRRLDTGDEENVWTFIGRSAIAAVDGNRQEALDAANRAVSLAGDNFHAQYQLGLVKVVADDFHGAAEALERATQIDDGDAYAHYYAGVAFNKIKRLDKMTEHFRAFVQLAPEAPERPQVEAILRTLRR